VGWGTIVDAAKRFRYNQELLRGPHLFKDQKGTYLNKNREFVTNEKKSKSQKIFFSKMRKSNGSEKIASFLGSFMIGCLGVLLLSFVGMLFYYFIIEYLI